MKITLATDFDSKNINTWSGLGIYYSRMLKQAGFELNHITDRDLPFPFLEFLKIQYSKNLLGKIYSSRFDMTVSKKYGQIINSRLPDHATIISPNTLIVAHAKKRLKKILYTDATFLNLLNFYPGFSNLTKACLKEAVEIDQLAIKNADLLIYTSQWAADSAIKEYKADPSKIAIIPFGANLDFLPSYEEVKKIIAKRELQTHIHLLFIGVVWERKGGDYAMKVTKRLNDAGIPTSLHITGIPNLPAGIDSRYIVDHGHISKSTSEGQRKISNLIAQSNFLIMPSIADCTPVSFSEANAFGLPCMVSNVGGHSEIIKNNVNGIIYDLSDFVENSVNYIISLREQEKKGENAYQELCCSSYKKYAEDLNWNTIGNKIAKLIKSI